MDVEGQDRVVGPVPIVSAEGTVFPPTIIQGEIRQTLPMIVQVGTAIVASPVRQHEFVDEGTVLHLYGWRKDRPAVGWGRTPQEAREHLILDMMDGL